MNLGDLRFISLFGFSGCFAACSASRKAIICGTSPSLKCRLFPMSLGFCTCSRLPYRPASALVLFLVPMLAL